MEANVRTVVNAGTRKSAAISLIPSVYLNVKLVEKPNKMTGIRYDYVVLCFTFYPK